MKLPPDSIRRPRGHGIQLPRKQGQTGAIGHSGPLSTVAGVVEFRARPLPTRFPSCHWQTRARRFFKPPPPPPPPTLFAAVYVWTFVHSVRGKNGVLTCRYQSGKTCFRLSECTLATETSKRLQQSPMGGVRRRTFVARRKNAPSLLPLSCPPLGERGREKGF